MERDVSALRARADELAMQFDSMRAGLSGLQEKLRAVTVTETSDDGLVKATVGPRGQLTRLELDPRIYRKPDSRHLATVITETIRRAAESAADRIEDLCRPFMPDAQFEAHMNVDFDAIFHQLDSELPKGDEQ